MQETVKPPRDTKLIRGRTGSWEVVIGMEVHAQVTSRAKLFSGASAAFGGAPNSHVSLVDAAMPGMLPVINAECVAQAVRTGLGLNARINPRSVFDRKNYFYPDLPQGYQISQYKQPIVGEGEIEVELADGERITVGIERLHLEQDAGKSVHDQHPALSFVDLNRSGVALMEIVSRPDLRSAEEARAFLTKLRSILRYLGTCDGNMEEGSLRADVNVSVRRPGEPLGTRCEIKNVNSIRFVGMAIDHEARRQIEVIEDGGLIDQETRLFDPGRGETRPMRSKEEAHDYRYFPDPDLLPLELDPDWVEGLKAALPELPDAKRQRFLRFGLRQDDAYRLTLEREVADAAEDEFFRFVELKRGAYAADLARKLFGRGSSAVIELTEEDDGAEISALSGLLILGATNISNLILGPISAKANDAGEPLVDLLKRSRAAEIAVLFADRVISSSIIRQLFDILWTEGGDPAAIVEARGLRQVTDAGAIEAAVAEVIAANPDKAAQVRDKPQLIGWFVGQVMKASGGKANPQAVNDLLKAKLGL